MPEKPGIDCPMDNPDMEDNEMLVIEYVATKDSQVNFPLLI